MEMERMIDEVRQEFPGAMMFIDDIVICTKRGKKMKENLVWWRFMLERSTTKVAAARKNTMKEMQPERRGYWKQR